VIIHTLKYMVTEWGSYKDSNIVNRLLDNIVLHWYSVLLIITYILIILIIIIIVKIRLIVMMIIIFIITIDLIRKISKHWKRGFDKTEKDNELKSLR